MPASRPRGRKMAAAVAAAVALGALTGCASSAVHASDAGGPPLSATAARALAADWPTFDFDARRSGVGPANTGITAAGLRRLGLRIVHVNGTVDSAPIELHGIRAAGRLRDIAYVTTTYGRTVAFDPGTGSKLWEFTPSDISAYAGSAQVTTATPVADPDRRYVYAASPNGLIHKLAAATGREVRSAHWPARVTVDPTKEKIASALGVTGGSLIVVTGGYIGDAPVYQGHLVLIDRHRGVLTHVFNSLCSDHRGLIDPPAACPHSDAAIWARAGAVVEPGSGRLLVATGNADFDGRTNWGDSVLELSAAARLLHNWTPTDQAALGSSDTDVGSTAPALVDTGGRHLAVQGGKAGRLYLLDLDRLNGTRGGPGPRLGGQLASVSSPGGDQVLTAPVVWSHAGRSYVFVTDDSGTAAYRVSGGRHPRIARVWSNGSAGTSPVLAGGLLYVYDAGAGTLNVYSPVSGHRVGSLGAAPGHWNSPIVVGGRIILPVGSYHSHTQSGEILIWHVRGR